MSLHTLATLAILESKKYLAEPLSMIDFGNQRVRVNLNHKKLRAITSDYNLKIRPQDRNTPGASKFVKQLGFTDYDSIDLNNLDGSLVMDLNFDIVERYDFRKKYKIVLNNGTGEHIFNQHNIFYNMHNLCQVGGVILNILPVGPYLNHGFYNYNPVLFRDIAYANNYEFKFCWIGNSSGEYEEFDIFGQVCKETKRDRPLSLRTQYGIVFKRNRYSTIEKFIFKKIKKWGNLNIVVAYVKKYELDFEIPLQGKWVHNIDHGSNNQDVLKYLNQPDTFKDFHS